MKPQDVADAIELAYESLKRKSRLWLEESGPEFAMVWEGLLVCSEIKGPVVERDGGAFGLVYDGDGNLVPTMSGGIPEEDVYCIYDDEKGARLIARAEKGDPIACDVLRIVAAHFVEAGCPIPKRLRKYIIDFLLFAVPRPELERGRRGPDPYNNHLRNCHIAHTVLDIVQQGFKPTRNRATTKVESACSIVAKALPKIGVHLSESAVEKIWGEFPELHFLDV